jgi:hypothetical protein
MLDNFTLKSVFIFDPSLRPKKRKPSDDEVQDSKLLYYYPNEEDLIVKRSNMGIIEGSISFMDAFEQSESLDKFIFVEMTRFYYIANIFQDNKYIGMILQKINTIEFNINQNIETKKKWFKKFLTNFNEILVTFHGPIHEIFFKTHNNSLLPEIDKRDDPNSYKNISETLNDFVSSYFEILPLSRMPFYTNMLYFPLNENSHCQLLLTSQRLREKMPDIKYITLMYKGYMLHNEAHLDTISLLYNSFYCNLDGSPKFYNFNRPPYQVIQTVYSGNNDNMPIQANTSNFRKAFELKSESGFLLGISKLNINNYNSFLPEIYFVPTKEKLKLLVFYQNGLLIFLFLNSNYDPQAKVNNLIKLEKNLKRYFEEEIPPLETLYKHKATKFDTITFAYVNSSNKSIKLSSNFFNKRSRQLEKEKLDLLMNLLKSNYKSDYCSLSKIKGFLVYYIVTFERKVIVLLPDTIPVTSLKNTIEEIKKELFDFIFIL